MDYKEESLKLHKKLRGKISVESKAELNNREDLSLLYTPGVAAPCLEIAENQEKVKDYTNSAHTVAVISDGSAVLGLGNIGAKASIPVMEGKAVLFKRFANIDAFPIVLDTQDTEEIIQTIKNLAPSFGGINLEDISAPRCFEIEKRLDKELDIPVFHDDQHGTAIVVLAGIINALKITCKDLNAKVVMNGSGAAGVAITKLLHAYGLTNIIVCDSRGIISKGRDNLNSTKEELLEFTNKENLQGNLRDAIKGADIFIGVSKENLLTKEDVQTMNKDSIIMAMANPTPEILPDEAKKGGARIVATGRSDFPNQLNNVLVFPGIFKGFLRTGVEYVTMDMKLNAAKALANLVENPTEDKIIPEPFDDGVADAIADSVKKE